MQVAVTRRMNWPPQLGFDPGAWSAIVLAGGGWILRAVYKARKAAQDKIVHDLKVQAHEDARERDLVERMRAEFEALVDAKDERIVELTGQVTRLSTEFKHAIELVEGLKRDLHASHNESANLR